MERCLLSVYWDIDGNSHVNIPKWASSNEPTPFQNKVIKALKKNERIVVFDKEHSIFMQITDLYRELSDFSHTKGIRFSATALSKANFNRFNEDSITQWLDLAERVVKIVIAVHILQYPVGLQDIDLFGKFGLNPPMGGFLGSSDQGLIREFLDKEVLVTLQSISDSDPDATLLAQQIHELPDITKDQIRVQEENFEKPSIQSHPSGYKGWIKYRKKISKSERREIPKEYKVKARRWKKLKKWAKENGCFERSHFASGNN